MAMVDSIGAANAVKSIVPQLSIAGSYGLNVWNHCTIKALQNLFDRITLSPELSYSNIKVLSAGLSRTASAPILEFIVQGNLEVMVSENCILPLKEKYIQEAGGSMQYLRDVGLIDQKQRLFPITIDEFNRTHIYNSVETCLIDHLP
jgi:putative protease